MIQLIICHSIRRTASVFMENLCSWVSFFYVTKFSDLILLSFRNSCKLLFLRVCLKVSSLLTSALHNVCMHTHMHMCLEIQTNTGRHTQRHKNCLLHRLCHQQNIGTLHNIRGYQDMFKMTSICKISNVDYLNYSVIMWPRRWQLPHCFIV